MSTVNSQQCADSETEKRHRISVETDDTTVSPRAIKTIDGFVPAAWLDGSRQREERYFQFGFDVFSAGASTVSSPRLIEIM